MAAIEAGGSPRHASHYHLGARRPFQNLSDLDDTKAIEVMDELNALRHRGVAHRRFGLPYLLMRRETELRLRQLFVASGGRPERTTPHYFVIGDCAWFEGLATDMQAIRIELTDLDPEQVTLTYGDSFTAMRVSQAWGFGADDDGRPYQSKIFSLDQLDWLLGTYGPPDGSADEDYDAYEHRTGERFIELQLWSDDPVRAWLPPADGPDRA